MPSFLSAWRTAAAICRHSPCVGATIKDVFLFLAASRYFWQMASSRAA